MIKSEKPHRYGRKKPYRTSAKAAPRKPAGTPPQNRHPKQLYERVSEKETKNAMKYLEDRIRKDGRILPGNVLKVDNFLNHQIDVGLLNELGKEWARLFADEKVDKILTIEASGIGIACVAAQYFGVPVVFAKKSKSNNIGADLYCSKVVSYTHGQTYDVVVSKKYLTAGEHVLLIDDFLANGSALRALRDLVTQAGGVVVGAGIAIEKSFQSGGKELRAEGLRIESLAKIASMTDDSITFAD